LKKLIFLFYSFFLNYFIQSKMSTNRQSICEITSIRAPLSPIQVSRVVEQPKRESAIPTLNMNLIDYFKVLTDDFINVSLNSEKSPGFKADSYKTPPRPIAKVSQPEPAEYAHYQAHLRKRRSQNPVELPVFDLPPRIVRQRL
jgi:hypothetical protein